MDDGLPVELIAAAIGDIGLGGSGLLLGSSAEKVSSRERGAPRSHNRNEHVSVLVVGDVARGVLAERVADLTVEGPVLPRYESPGPNERVG
jgi:hypothetical protein